MSAHTFLMGRIREERPEGSGRQVSLVEAKPQTTEESAF